jgi:hypothetical protein
MINNDKHFKKDFNFISELNFLRIINELIKEFIKFDFSEKQIKNEMF